MIGEHCQHTLAPPPPLPPRFNMIGPLPSRLSLERVHYYADAWGQWPIAKTTEFAAARLTRLPQFHMMFVPTTGRTTLLHTASSDD